MYRELIPSRAAFRADSFLPHSNLCNSRRFSRGSRNPMRTALRSSQTSALRSETALEAELGKGGLRYRTWKICLPAMANDLFKTKIEGLNESIAESHHSTGIMGCIKVCHQLHVTVRVLFPSSLKEKVNFFFCWWRWRNLVLQPGSSAAGLGITWGRGIFQQMQQEGRVWWAASAQGWQRGAKKEKPCLQGDWRQPERANRSLSFTSCIHWPYISKHLKLLLFLLS